MGSLCSALSVVVLAGGVVMFNNYEKMREMESVITSALPVAAGEKDNPAALPGDELYGSYKDYSDTGEGDELLIEEAHGKISPTTEPATMSPTYPGETESEGGDINAITPAPTMNPEETPQEGSSETATQPESPAAAATTNEQKTYTVQDGQTLYSICLEVYNSLNKVDEICALNNLESQDKIISGQKLILP